MSKFICKVRVGDKIRLNGYTVKIAEILSQDFYVDEFCEYDGTEDRSYIDLEFKDENGKYRHWKSHLDGGEVRYSEDGIETTKYPREAVGLYSVVYDMLKDSGFSCKDGFCSIIQVDNVWSVYYVWVKGEKESIKLGYVEESDKEFYEFVKCVTSCKGSDIYAIVCPSAVFRDEKYKSKLIVCREKEDYALLVKKLQSSKGKSFKKWKQVW